MAEPNGGGGPRRPGADDPMAEVQRILDELRTRWGGGVGGGIGGAQGPGMPKLSVSPYLIIGAALLLYAMSGIFIVGPDERGIVLRFGRIVREAEPGPGYHLPWPIEEVLRPSVTRIRKEEFGFRTTDVGPPARYRDVDPEALMLTGDENIVKRQFIVQYRVKPGGTGTTDFLFSARNPHRSVRDAAEAAMREIVGRNDIDDVLTEGKDRIQQDSQALLQRILDQYQIGIEIMTVKLQDVDPPDQVSDAFKDVISAQQDKERLINESLGYANDVVPKARGQAVQTVNEAKAFAEVKVRDAEGQAQRFTALYDEYAKAKEVTRLRLYLETMEAVMPRINKIVLDDLAAERAVPYLPLEPLLKRRPNADPAGATP